MKNNLRVPKNFNPENLPPTACGNLTVEGFMYAEGMVDGFSGTAIQVARKIMGGMLEWHLHQSLVAKGVHRASIFHTANLDYDKKIEFIQDQLDKGHPVALLVGLGAGHWLSVWRYNSQEKVFYCFDSRRKVERNESGLTEFSYHELHELWGKEVFLFRLVRLLSQLPWWKDQLNYKPFTAITITCG